MAGGMRSATRLPPQRRVGSPRLGEPRPPLLARLHVARSPEERAREVAAPFVGAREATHLGRLLLPAVRREHEQAPLLTLGHDDPGFELSAELRGHHDAPLLGHAVLVLAPEPPT